MVLDQVHAPEPAPCWWKKGLREASTLTYILNTHRLKLLLGSLGQFRQVQATQTQKRHRHRSKRTPETYRQRKMRRERQHERERGEEKGEGGWMEHDIGAGEVSGSERKKQAEQELRFDEVLSNIVLYIY